MAGQTTGEVWLCTRTFVLLPVSTGGTGEKNVQGKKKKTRGNSKEKILEFINSVILIKVWICECVCDCVHSLRRRLELVKEICVGSK